MQEILEKLSKGILSYDEELTKETTNEGLKKGMNPIELINVLSASIRNLGEKYESGEVFLPELMMAADAMKAAMTILEPELLKRKEEVPIRKIAVTGTVKGDVHDIGKTMVSMMLTSAGFKVHDLGRDVSYSAFYDAAENNGADILALSAAMTTTMPSQRDVIEYFKALGTRDKYKIIVGGGSVTPEFATEIGADGYGKDLIEAVKVAKKLVNK